MIIDRYIIKEIVLTFFGVTFVLLLIFLSALLLRLFDDAARGLFQVNTIMLLMAFKSIGNLVFILPLAMYLSILLAMSRFYKDNEMAALAASGVGQIRVLRAVILLSIMFAGVVGLLTLYLAPWAQQQTDIITANSKASSELDGINPGRFRGFSDGNGTLYVQYVDEKKTRLKNIFIQSRDPDGNIIVTAQQGIKFTDLETGDDFIELSSGYRYQGDSGDVNYSIVHFKKHGIRIRQKPPQNIYYHKLATPTNNLISSSKLTDIIELHSRISLMLMCLVLSILAVPLSRTSPRQGQYAKLTIAILIYISYANLLSINRVWLEKEKIPIEASFWWLHIVVFIFAMVIILKQTGISYYFKRQVKI